MLYEVITITPGAIESTHLQAGSVREEQIGSSEIKGRHLADRSVTSTVITSYSIHYTKLYDNSAYFFPEALACRALYKLWVEYPIDDHPCQSISVITSYSIHYTKLYD